MQQNDFTSRWLSELRAEPLQEQERPARLAPENCAVAVTSLGHALLDGEVAEAICALFCTCGRESSRCQIHTRALQICSSSSRSTIHDRWTCDVGGTQIVDDGPHTYR